MTITQASAQSADDVEAERLRAVERYAILDTPADDAFDRIARVAARCLGTAMATVSIVDTDRIWFKAACGFDGVPQVDRDTGLCASAILGDGPYVVRDALTDPRTAGNRLVHGEWGIRFYAAAPIVTSDGHRIGTVDVLDTKPRNPTDDDIATLSDLAAIVMDELELRLSALTTVRVDGEPRDTAEPDRATIEDYAGVLQRSLLPPSLPNIPGVSLAAHYHPASSARVGGDFYDVFAFGKRRWAFFLGDVEAHGAAAAAVTSLVQTLLLHTDGITEARPDGPECFGEETLRAFVADRANLPAADLVNELAALVRTLQADDDVALLALTADR